MADVRLWPGIAAADTYLAAAVDNDGGRSASATDLGEEASPPGRSPSGCPVGSLQVGVPSAPPVGSQEWVSHPDIPQEWVSHPDTQEWVSHPDKQEWVSHPDKVADRACGSLAARTACLRAATGTPITLM